MAKEGQASELATELQQVPSSNPRPNIDFLEVKDNAPQPAQIIRTLPEKTSPEQLIPQLVEQKKYPEIIQVLKNNPENYYLLMLAVRPLFPASKDKSGLIDWKLFFELIAALPFNLPVFFHLNIVEPNRINTIPGLLDIIFDCLVYDARIAKKIDEKAKMAARAIVKKLLSKILMAELDFNQQSQLINHALQLPLIKEYNELFLLILKNIKLTQPLSSIVHSPISVGQHPEQNAVANMRNAILVEYGAEFCTQEPIYCGYDENRVPILHHNQYKYYKDPGYREALSTQLDTVKQHKKTILESKDIIQADNLCDYIQLMIARLRLERMKEKISANWDAAADANTKKKDDKIAVLTKLKSQLQVPVLPESDLIKLFVDKSKLLSKRTYAELEKIFLVLPGIKQLLDKKISMVRSLAGKNGIQQIAERYLASIQPAVAAAARAVVK